MDMKIDKIEVSIRMLRGDTVEETQSSLKDVIKIVEAIDFKEAELYTTTVSEYVDLSVDGKYRDKRELLSLLPMLVYDAAAIRTLELILYL